MKFSLTQALPLNEYDLSLLTEAEIQYIKKAKNNFLQNCRAQSCFELRRMVGVSSSKAAVLRNEKGQPYFADLEYNISISHKDQNCWLGLVKKPGIIGVDIEKIVQVELSEIMYRHIANESEKKQYQNLSLTYSKEIYVTILWSLKESLYKCENARHEDLSFLLDPSKEIAHLSFHKDCYLGSLWLDKEIQIKYSIQKDYVYSSIYVF